MLFLLFQPSEFDQIQPLAFLPQTIDPANQNAQQHYHGDMQLRHSNLRSEQEFAPLSRGDGIPSIVDENLPVFDNQPR